MNDQEYAKGLLEAELAIRHPSNTGPDYTDKYGYTAKIVQCPDCGQMEWWPDDELTDHGRCRTGQYPCVCDEKEQGS